MVVIDRLSWQVNIWCLWSTLRCPSRGKSELSPDSYDSLFRWLAAKPTMQCSPQRALLLRQWNIQGKGWRLIQYDRFQVFMSFSHDVPMWRFPKMLLALVGFIHFFVGHELHELHVILSNQPAIGVPALQESSRYDMTPGIHPKATPYCWKTSAHWSSAEPSAFPYSSLVNRSMLWIFRHQKWWLFMI